MSDGTRIGMTVTLQGFAFNGKLNSTSFAMLGQQFNCCPNMNFLYTMP
jgi:hypothetical protein